MISVHWKVEIVRALSCSIELLKTAWIQGVKSSTRENAVAILSACMSVEIRIKDCEKLLPISKRSTQILSFKLTNMCVACEERVSKVMHRPVQAPPFIVTVHFQRLNLPNFRATRQVPMKFPTPPVAWMKVVDFLHQTQTLVR